MILTHNGNIDEMFELTLNQGHKVKGQAQINTYVKKLKNRYLIEIQIDDDDIYTYW